MFELLALDDPTLTEDDCMLFNFFYGLGVPQINAEGVIISGQMTATPSAPRQRRGRHATTAPRSRALFELPLRFPINSTSSTSRG